MYARFKIVKLELTFFMGFFIIEAAEAVNGWEKSRDITAEKDTDDNLWDFYI